MHKFVSSRLLEFYVDGSRYFDAFAITSSGAQASTFGLNVTIRAARNIFACLLDT